HVTQADEGHQVAQPTAGPADSDVASEPSGGELKAGQSLDRDGVRSHSPDVTDDHASAAVAHERREICAEHGDVGALDDRPDGPPGAPRRPPLLVGWMHVDLRCRLPGQTAGPRKTHRTRATRIGRGVATRAAHIVPAWLMSSKNSSSA